MENGWNILMGVFVLETIYRYVIVPGKSVDVFEAYI